MSEQYTPQAFGAVGDGVADDTHALQQLIDTAAAAATAEQPVTVHITKGTYLIAGLFLHSHLRVYLDAGATLLGTIDETKLPIMWTRVAGIEMDWYVGVLNLNDCTDVKVFGPGRINGQGPYWWHKYWGNDRHGGMRKGYDARGLRWVIDYDCKRVRNVVVMNSKDIDLDGFESYQSGFWNVHLCYSQHVHVANLLIHGNDEGPSTDGIDVDSCEHVVVEKCSIDCNDDSVCIKSGRDADGLKVNRICQDVLVQDCEILKGDGITLGSETSGGIRDITVRHIQYRGTKNGFRIKSARNRGGVLQDVLVEDVQMLDVKKPFSFNLNWNPAYSYSELPADYQGDVPEHWKKLLEVVPESIGIPEVKNIMIRDVKATMTPGHEGPIQAVEIVAFPEKPMSNITFDHVDLKAKTMGPLSAIKDVHIRDLNISLSE